MHADPRPDTSASSPAPADPTPLPIAPLLLDEAQAAALLSLSPRKLWELAARGAIKSVKIGALKRYRRVDLEEWVASGCPTE
jgi:excisionase family DNA binding protein